MAEDHPPRYMRRFITGALITEAQQITAPGTGVVHQRTPNLPAFPPSPIGVIVIKSDKECYSCSEHRTEGNGNGYMTFQPVSVRQVSQRTKEQYHQVQPPGEAGDLQKREFISQQHK